MNQRGFTLIELMIVTVILAIVAGALGALYLEARVSGARVEASLELEREAAVATEWLRRDLRGATAVATTTTGLTITRGPLPRVRYLVDEGRLVRDDGAPRALGRRFRALSAEPVSERVERISLSLERPLSAQTTARIERSFVAVRLP